MAKATHEAILDRRMDMLFLDRLGIRPWDWIQEISFKHHTTPAAVRRDWSRRKTWMRQLLKIEDAEALGFNILYDYEKAVQDAYRLYDDATSIADKVHCLWARLKAIQLREKYLTTIGALEQIRIDMQYTADSHQERKDEEKHPYLKGDRDRDIRMMALLKGMPRDEFMKRMTKNKGR